MADGGVICMAVSAFTEWQDVRQRGGSRQNMLAGSEIQPDLIMCRLGQRPVSAALLLCTAFGLNFSKVQTELAAMRSKVV